jgi:hypothetical protein
VAYCIWEIKGLVLNWMGLMLTKLLWTNRRLRFNRQLSESTHNQIRGFTKALRKWGQREPAHQWWSVPFKTSKDDYLWPWIYFYCSILDDRHSYSFHPAQYNIDKFRLLDDIKMFPIPMMRLLQPRLWMKVCRCTGREVHRSREIWVIKMTDIDTFNTALHILE